MPELPLEVLLNILLQAASIDSTILAPVICTCHALRQYGEVLLYQHINTSSMTVRTSLDLDPARFKALLVTLQTSQRLANYVEHLELTMLDENDGWCCMYFGDDSDDDDNDDGGDRWEEEAWDIGESLSQVFARLHHLKKLVIGPLHNIPGCGYAKILRALLTGQFQLEQFRWYHSVCDNDREGQAEFDCVRMLEEFFKRQPSIKNLSLGQWADEGLSHGDPYPMLDPNMLPQLDSLEGSCGVAYSILPGRHVRTLELKDWRFSRHNPPELQIVLSAFSRLETLVLRDIQQDYPIDDFAQHCQSLRRLVVDRWVSKF
jgi:hypothetical protein